MSATTVGAATAVTALLIGSTAAVADESRADSAYGFAASGLLDTERTPYVESEDGEPVSDELVGLGSVPGASEAGVSAGLFTVEARRGAAESSVAKLDLAHVLRADLVRTYCEDARGGLQIVGGSFMGRDVPESPFSGQTMDFSPLASATFGEETENSDGSVTVTGIELTLLPGGDEDEQDTDRESAGSERESRLTSGERTSLLDPLTELTGVDLSGAATMGEAVDTMSQALGDGIGRSESPLTVTIGSATCHAVEAEVEEPEHEEEKERDREPAAHDAPPAPKPEIVEADLPVTG